MRWINESEHVKSRRSALSMRVLCYGTATEPSYKKQKSMPTRQCEVIALYQRPMGPPRLRPLDDLSATDNARNKGQGI